MKSLLSVVCALLLLGCSNDSTPTETPTPTPEVTAAPIPAEVADANTTPAEPTTPESKPVAAAVEEAPKAPAVANVDGGALYGQKCASCHGAKAEKSALNKSQIIAQFSETQVKEALKGYQAGTYGKEMKALMQGQAKALDDAQIDALAKHISAL